uniref:Transmembrane protein n=1 Tax=Kryptolebias marmoratus TaxID=37003 RepID=A0A3Q2ZZ94_KRYMA
MKPQSWIRRNWFWAAGGAFATIHLSTWILQKVTKSSVRSEVELKRQTPGERTD